MPLKYHAALDFRPTSNSVKFIAVCLVCEKADYVVQMTCFSSTRRGDWIYFLTATK